MATKKKISAQKASSKQSKRTVKSKAPKKVAQKAQPKEQVPYGATNEGMKQLKHHCENIMAIVGDLVLSTDPKMSQKKFTTKSHAVIRVLFGMKA
jgi:hypothetical protein